MQIAAWRPRGLVVPPRGTTSAYGRAHMAGPVANIAADEHCVHEVARHIVLGQELSRLHADGFVERQLAQIDAHDLLAYCALQFAKHSKRSNITN